MVGFFLGRPGEPGLFLGGAGAGVLPEVTQGNGFFLRTPRGMGIVLALYFRVHPAGYHLVEGVAIQNTGPDSRESAPAGR